MVKEEPLSFLIIQPLPVCALCLEEKMIKRSFPEKDNRSKGVLELIYINVCGTLNVKAKGGFQNFITFIDDYSKYDYVTP